MSEVGIDRGVDRQIRGEQVFHVGAYANLALRSGSERVGRICLHARGLRRSVREDLQVLRGCGNAQSVEVPIARRSALFVARPHGPLCGLVPAFDEPTNLQSKRLQRVARKAELTEGDAHFHRPAVLVESRLGHPHRIPAIVATRVGIALHVCAGSGGVDLKERHAQVVVKSVNDHLKKVRVEERIAPNNTADDAVCTPLVIQPRAHVQRGVVKKESDVNPLTRWLGVIRVKLFEVGDRSRVPPRVIVYASIKRKGAALEDSSSRRNRELVSRGPRCR